MNLSFSSLDWAIFVIYGLILSATAWYWSQRNNANSQDFFLAGHSMPVWMVAISTLATLQSAATFLGGPDLGYQSDFSYLFTNLGAIVAALIVAKYLIPLFYQQKVTTVYELLQSRFGAAAKRQAGGVYLVGRVFASGARLYMAAIAVSMMLFSDISAGHVLIAISILAVVSLGQTLMGGARSVIQSDVLQCFVYVAAAVSVLVVLLWQIPADLPGIANALATPINDAEPKLVLIDWRWNWNDPFTVWATFTGFVLLNIAAFGLDQDVTQRVLTCKTSLEGTKAMLWSVLLVIPVIATFIAIGMLLYIFYQRPDVMGDKLGQLPQIEDVTVFMHYVLNELPSGIRGLVVIGVIAAALSTLTSGLNSMASVITEDFYRPWIEQRQRQISALHFVYAGRIAMVLVALLLSAMAILCFYWHQVSNLPLLAFALSVMVFAYSGLLGVFFTALFTDRGSPTSVWLALVAGFLVPLSIQPWMVQMTQLSHWIPPIAFPWQLCLGTSVAFIVCVCGTSSTSATTHDVTQEALA